MGTMARIVTLYNTERRAADLGDMSYIRWFKISEALAGLGHHVDIATAESKWRLRKPVVQMGANLRRIPLGSVPWGEYDVVKALFHQGFETLRRHGGHRHPFVICKLGSVVGPHDMDGIYFYGRTRRRLYREQERIASGARYVTVLTAEAADLWKDCHGSPEKLLLVPGAADEAIPAPGPDPFGDAPRPRYVFSGNVYTRRTQPEANRVLIDKLNTLGSHIAATGGRLFVVGPGDVRRLDPSCATWLGAVPYAASWDYLHHADVGILVAAGPFMHNNESTKIYHYLRAGLPVVSEAGFPNDRVLEESGLAFVVPNGDLPALAARALEAASHVWDRDAGRRYILENHTWEVRARTYDRLFRDVLG
jgi:glycosyltransferase involved in cell wall biosynthesis